MRMRDRAPLKWPVPGFDPYYYHFYSILEIVVDSLDRYAGPEACYLGDVVI